MATNESPETDGYYWLDDVQERGWGLLKSVKDVLDECSPDQPDSVIVDKLISECGDHEPYDTYRAFLKRRVGEWRSWLGGG